MGRMVQVPFGRAMVTRMCPDLPPQHFRSYSMRSPLRTHWRDATCDEYECPQYLNGFEITVDVSTELGQRQFHYLTHDNTRSCRREQVGPTLHKFTYPPGNQCFSSPEKQKTHRVKIDRPPIYLVYRGDWRGVVGEQVTHRRAEDWVDDFSNHNQRLADIRRRG